MGSEKVGSPPLGWAYGPAGRFLRSCVQTGLLFPVVRFLTPIAIRGRDQLAGLSGPVIVTANHVSHLDTPVVLIGLTRRVRRRLLVAAAKDYFYSSRIKGILVSLSLATYPFDRQEGSRHSIAETEAMLEEGWSLLIFPEGTRSPSGELGRVRSGAAVLASKTGVPIVPVYVHGLAKVMPKGTAAPLPGGVVVDIGEPIRAEPGESVLNLRERIETALRTLAQQAPAWGGSKTI